MPSLTGAGPLQDLSNTTGILRQGESVRVQLRGVWYGGVVAAHKAKGKIRVNWNGEATWSDVSSRLVKRLPRKRSAAKKRSASPRGAGKHPLKKKHRGSNESGDEQGQRRIVALMPPVLPPRVVMGPPASRPPLGAKRTTPTSSSSSSSSTTNNTTSSSSSSGGDKGGTSTSTPNASPAAAAWVSEPLATCNAVAAAAAAVDAAVDAASGIAFVAIMKTFVAIMKRRLLDLSTRTTRISAMLAKPRQLQELSSRSLADPHQRPWPQPWPQYEVAFLHESVVSLDRHRRSVDPTAPPFAISFHIGASSDTSAANEHGEMAPLSGEPPQITAMELMRMGWTSSTHGKGKVEKKKRKRTACNQQDAEAWVTKTKKEENLPGWTITTSLTRGGRIRKLLVAPDRTRCTTLKAAREHHATTST